MKILIREEQLGFLYDKKRVMVYYNLHKHTFSIKYKDKLLMHADYVKLSDVEFRVRQGGKEKVRLDKSKNVHAFVIGNLEDFCEYPCNNIPEPKGKLIATYNPYENDSFVIKNTNIPIKKATEVDLINSKNKIYITKD